MIEVDMKKQTNNHPHTLRGLSRYNMTRKGHKLQGDCPPTTCSNYRQTLWFYVINKIFTTTSFRVCISIVGFGLGMTKLLDLESLIKGEDLSWLDPTAKIGCFRNSRATNPWAWEQLGLSLWTFSGALGASSTSSKIN